MIFNQSGGSASPTLQTKTVSPSTSSQLIVPDAGFDALSQVTVNAAPLQAKTATIGSSQTIIKPDSGQYGLSQVTVPAAALQSKAVTPSSSYQTITPSSGYYGLSSVGVSAVAVKSARFHPNAETNVYKPESPYIGYSQVTIPSVYDEGYSLLHQFSGSDLTAASFHNTVWWWRFSSLSYTAYSLATLYAFGGCVNIASNSTGEDLVLIFSPVTNRNLLTAPALWVWMNVFDTGYSQWRRLDGWMVEVVCGNQLLSDNSRGSGVFLTPYNSSFQKLDWADVFSPDFIETASTYIWPLPQFYGGAGFISMCTGPIIPKTNVLN